MNNAQREPDGRLLQVFPPTGVQDDTSTDLIAIHGLGTTSPLTWEAVVPAKEGSPETNVNWLTRHDMLPAAVPSARIYTFSWNSKYHEDAPVVRILDVAEVLLSKINNKRGEEGSSHSRPLIFVASCFGGLIVTKALEIANVSGSMYRRLLLATSGVIFLGSPLQGTRAAKAAEWRVMLAGILGRNPSQTLLQDLDGSTKALREVSERFIGMISKPPMQTITVCFWETQASQVLNAVLPKWAKWAAGWLDSTKLVLVDKDSACFLGRRHLPLDAPHVMMNKFRGPQDANYELVRDAIKDMEADAAKIVASQCQADQTGDALKKVARLLSTVPFARDDKFIERKGIFERLDALLDSSAFDRRAALYGLGGIGKTQLAIEYSFQTLERRPGTAVFWIFASDTIRVLQSFKDIAIKLDLPGYDNPKTNVAAIVRQWLDDGSNGSWMVILDNVDDIDVVEHFHPTLQDVNPETGAERRRLLDYIPKRPHGMVLVTSRDRRAADSVIGDKDRLILVDRMDEAESLELLKTKVSVNVTALEDAKVLVSLLDYIPLAITQAGAYLREQTITMDIADYCAEFSARESDQATLLNEEVKDLRRDPSVPNSVIVTWEISFHLIQQRQSRAADLLSLLAMFNRQSIPEELVKIENRLEFRRAVSILESFSFVKITNEPDRLLFSLHRLVQLATQKWLEKNDSEGHWRAQAIDRVAALFSFRKYETWEECDRLLAHAEKVVEYQSGVKETELQRGALISMIAWHSMSVGSFEIAVERAKECLRIYGQYLGEEDQQMMAGKSVLASTYWNQGRWDDAEALQVEVMETRKKKLGLDHPSTLTSMANLAATYGNQGRWDDAEALEVDVMETSKKKLGLDHPSTLTSMANLASTYWNQGRWDNAEALQVEVMKTSKKKLGLDHPSTLISMNNLASTYGNQGRWDDAEALQVEVIETSKKKLGVDHPSTLTSMNNLASTYGNQGRWDDAEALQVEVIETSKKKLGLDHPSTLTSMNNLALTYWNQGRWDDAEALQVEVMETSKKKLGVDHPSTLTSMANLAVTLKYSGRIAEAIILMQEAADKSILKLGIKHPNSVARTSSLREWKSEH